MSHPFNTGRLCWVPSVLHLQCLDCCGKVPEKEQLASLLAAFRGRLWGIPECHPGCPDLHHPWPHVSGLHHRKHHFQERWVGGTQNPSDGCRSDCEDCFHEKKKQIWSYDLSEISLRFSYVLHRTLVKGSTNLGHLRSMCKKSSKHQDKFNSTEAVIFISLR